MALTICSDNPKALWRHFVGAIKAEAITTWEFDSSGMYFTHASAQWREKAWFCCKSQPDRLIFTIHHSDGAKVSMKAYAEYHGLLLRVFLAHFDGEFSSGSATAMPRLGDEVALGWE